MGTPSERERGGGKGGRGLLALCTVFTELGGKERCDCVLLCLMAARQCGLKASPVDTGAQHNTDGVERRRRRRRTAARGLTKAQFVCSMSHFAAWFPTIPHISSVELAMGVLYPSYFLHRSAHFKLLRVMVVFRHPHHHHHPLLELPFLPPLTLKIKSINQKEKGGGGVAWQLKGI